MTRRLLVPASTSLALALSLTMTAQAQDQDSTEGVEASEARTLDTVVVTSRKRAEDLQDVPVTVDAFSEAKIEQAGIEGMRDFVALSPNISLVETQNTGFAFVNIRGLSTVRNSDPTVAVVIDGVLASSGLGFSQELFDVQQIEVLKGPQGALYGRNATGGAINITTKQPTDEVEGFVKLGYGNGEAFSAIGTVSGPIAGEDLLGRLSVSYKEADGWRDNVSLNEKADPYEDFSVRGKVLWNVSDDITADFRLAYADTSASPSQFFVNSPNFVTPLPEGGLPGTAHNFGGRTNGAASVLPGQPASIARLVGDPNNTSVQIQGNSAGDDVRELWSATAKFDWEVPFGTITSITSFEDIESVAWGQEGFPYFPLLQSSADPTAGTRSDAIVLPPSLFGALSSINSVLGQNRFLQSTSQEIRITSPSDQRFRWIVGGYYLETDLDVLISVNNDLGQGAVRQTNQPNIGGINPTATFNERFIATVAPTLAALYGANPAAIPTPCLPGGGPLENLPDNVCGAILANPNSNPNALSFTFDENRNTAWALFAQFNYDLTDNLELSVAGRYDRDERELNIATAQEFLPVFPFASGQQGDQRTEEYEAFQPKVTLRWTPTEDLTLYSTYAQGFRSGGFNLSGVSSGINVLTAAGVPGLPAGVEDSWDQEDTENFEVGLKANLLNDTANVNLALFTSTIDDAFTFFFVPPFNAQVIRNIDEAEVSGVEFSASYRPVENLLLEFGAGVLDSEIKQSSWIGTGGLSVVGNKLPLNPESTVNFGATYDFVVSDRIDGYVRFDYNRLGETPFEAENFIKRDAIDLINLRAGLTMDDWQVTAWAKNLTDEDYTAEFTNLNGISWPAKPLQYGLELRKSF